MATPPVIGPDWATDPNALIQDPGQGKRELGFGIEIPPVEYFNYIVNNHGEWINYLSEEVGLIEAVTGVFDAIVGQGAYNDLNAVVADMGVNLPATNVRVFVKNAIISANSCSNPPISTS